MKRLIICPILLAAIIALCAFSIIKTDTACAQMVSTTESIKSAADENDFDRAYSLSSELNRQWELTEKVFAFYLRHNDYDDLAQSIAQLGAFAYYGEQPELVATCETVISQLHHLNESQQLTWENIF